MSGAQRAKYAGEVIQIERWIGEDRVGPGRGVNLVLK